MDKNTPVISIVIPVYNAAPYLSKCISSVCSQSFKNWEVLAVDDGSTDDSLKILQGIKEMIEDGGTGFVIKPFQKEEYLTKLRWLMDNQSEREAMGKNAYVRLSKYDIETIGKQWIALFNKIRVEQ